MKIAGIIAEYNPFHKGHAWHARETRRVAGCDYVVACMAGHFTQRGDPACASKWARARMALSCGVDAVFEMPALFAVRSADAFAQGGVAILGGLGVDVLCFGSETDDMELIRTLAALKSDEPKAVSARIREKLAAGMSHARARGEALGEYLGIPYDEINRPNLALAAEYVRAIAELQSSLRPIAVRRLGGYLEMELGNPVPESPGRLCDRQGSANGEPDGFASATAIRAAFERGEVDAALQAIPEAALPFAQPDRLHAMDDLLLYRLRGMSPERLAALPESGEGLEHRIYRLCRACATRDELLDALKCKRYTRARLSRMLTHALLGIDRQLVEACPLPPYARLLGMRREAGPLLRELDRRANIPIVSAVPALRDDPCFETECRATDLWALLHDAPELRRSGREYLEKFVVVD